MDERSGILANLSRVIATHGTGKPLMSRLCQASVALLQVDGCALTLAYNEPQRVTLCATDPTAEELEDLQDVLSEGPGPDAYETGRPVVVEMGGDDVERWPLFAESARRTIERGSIYAFPIHPGNEVLGVLTFYQQVTRPLGRTMTISQFLADAIGAAILREPDLDSELAEQSWSSRARVHQATGMVVAQLGITVDDALALLRAHAYAHDEHLVEIAEDVVGRRLDFRVTDNSNGSVSP